MGYSYSCGANQKYFQVVEMELLHPMTDRGALSTVLNPKKGFIIYGYGICLSLTGAPICLQLS